MNKEKFILKGIKVMPVNFHFLEKEKKIRTNLTYISFCKAYNGKLIVNTFYKPNSNILLINE